MKRFSLTLTSLFLFLAAGAKECLPDDVLEKLSGFNVKWTTASMTGSLESMPLGNGDITLNLWVENGGDLMMYIGKSDAWAESTRLLKVGRLRIRLTPNPFDNPESFSQVLNLPDGAVEIASAGPQGKCGLKIWVDANRPDIHIEVNADHKVSLECISELMRTEEYVLGDGGDPLADSFRGVTGSPVRPRESADIFLPDNECVIWAHRNEYSLYPVVMEAQNAGDLAGKYADPYIGRTFGAAIFGEGLVPVQSGRLASKAPAKSFDVDVAVLTAATQTLGQWKDSLMALADDIRACGKKPAFKSHMQWWRDFWNRSWIFLTGDGDAEKATRAYILQRYMMACQSRGAYPVKFNGGTLTFDYNGNNADFRRWGPGYWHQNCRLYYWPLVVSGDFDLLEPWFKMYMDMMPLQMDMTRKLYGHGGAFFPETLNMFGMYIQDDWGWNNKDGKASQTRWIRYHYSGALEMIALMCDRYSYTGDDDFARGTLVPFAEQTIRFFEEHWSLIDGQYSFIPANSLEQFWDCLNPADYIAGLKYDLSRLKSLPEGVVPEYLATEWRECERHLPALPVAEGRILPAYEYGAGRNFENPELYAVFPFRLYGLGLPDLDIAQRTYDARVFDAPTCWSQDAIQAALLGKADDARKYLMMKVNAIDPEIRFPAFWRPGSDYTPDLDNGGVIATAMQYMLLNNVAGQRMILPALPSGWSADFKLRVPGGGAVRVISEGNTPVSIKEYD